MEAARDAVAEHAKIVKDLKDKKADKAKVDAAVKGLQDAKEKLQVFIDEIAAKKKVLQDFRAGFEDLLLRKFFYVPAFEIYGGVGGLYDYGPPGCAIKTNLLSLWRQHFVLTENMHEVSCTSLTPDIVLRTSGHVDKFTDFMVKDVKTGDCHRADKILEDQMDKLVDQGVSEQKKAELLDVRTKAGAYSREDLAEKLKTYGVKAPDTGNDLGEPYAFNLMFTTSIGPTGKFVGYMRPETAQGIFVNFRRLLEYNSGRMPFASAQIGMAFRNEIAPRSGLLRVREFEMAEIEHFVHPNEKDHPKFKDVADYEMLLLGRADQTGEDISRLCKVGVAVKSGLINNETLAYFMARTHMFLVAAGVDKDRLRFRQHKSNEMAHYAQDCWDAEIHNSYGWIECVGHADRACYDLAQHTKVSKVDLSAEKVLAEPKITEVATAKIDKGLVGKTHKKAGQEIINYLIGLEMKEALEMDAKLKKGSVKVEVNGEKFEITKEMASWTVESKKISVEKYMPSVIEPSFGIGRCLYSLLEHAYTVRERNGEKMPYLKLSPRIAPIKVAILPIGNGPEFDAPIALLENEFIELGLATRVDSSKASIGRKYARADEVGTPLAITVDFDTVKEMQHWTEVRGIVSGVAGQSQPGVPAKGEMQTVTMRERDTMTQIRVKLSEAPGICALYMRGRLTWDQARARYPHFASPGDDKDL